MIKFWSYLVIQVNNKKSRQDQNISLLVTARVVWFSGGRVLQVPRAQLEDSGRYTCVAINEAGDDSIQYNVRVLGKRFILGTDTEASNF